MDFVSFSLNYWEDLWQSRHLITSRLALHHKVIFVSPPFTLGQVFGDFGKNNLPQSGLVHRCDSLYTLVFPKWLIEAPGHPWLDGFSGYLRNVYVRFKMRKLGFRDTVLMIWNPRYANLVGALGEAVSCYYVDDEFANYAAVTENEKQRIRDQEADALSKVDLVFANGPALLERKNQRGNAINVPMAVDFELFSKSRLATTTVPDDLEAVARPRIGYIGNVNDKVNLELIGQLAKARPAWSFGVIGPVKLRTPESRRQLDSLKSLPNFFSLGLKPREALPAYIKGLDVCLLCYRTDGWARYIYPLKLHEYFASGKPVVASSIASLLEFIGFCRIAREPTDWLEAIEEALEENDPGLAEGRVRTAYENRVEMRIQIITEVIERVLEAKTKRGST